MLTSFCSSDMPLGGADMSFCCCIAPPGPAMWWAKDGMPDVEWGGIPGVIPMAGVDTSGLAPGIKPGVVAPPGVTGEGGTDPGWEFVPVDKPSNLETRVYKRWPPVDKGQVKHEWQGQLDVSNHLPASNDIVQGNTF